MAYHHDLLILARQMVDRNPKAQVEAELRRAVSTAYYALFHLLIFEATDRLVAVAAIRPRVARTFDHKTMRAVCQEYADAIDQGAGQYKMKSGLLIPAALHNISSVVIALHEARTQADYNLAIAVEHVQAAANVGLIEKAFENWVLVENHASSDAFLSELWCRGIPKR